MASSRPPRRLAVVILAAGRGKRMKSDLPKVLHPVCGRPSLWHVLMAARAARPDSLSVVVSHGREQVEDVVRSWNIRPEPSFIAQGEPHGTGHAIMAAEAATDGAHDLLILPGDDPLIMGEHVRLVLRLHRRTGGAATILTTVVDDPTGFGRVIRDGNELVGIVEESEASPGVRAISEISTLVYAFRREELFRALPLVGRENRHREYYLPDVLAILKDKGERVSAVPVDLGGSLGLNTRRGLARVSAIMRDRIVDGHMARGVTFVDPGTTYVDVGVRIGPDSVIHPLTFLEGDTRIGRGCEIGPATRIVNTTVADGASVTFSVVRGSRVGRGATIGPYASLRPETVLEERAKAGSFVEIKKSRVGKGSKVPHLAYVGDATIGRDANIGAGTVTVNYDGYDKHPTVIGDEAKVGSDTMLVAPVKLGKRTWTGAGSVITRDVPAGALAVARAEQRNVPGYDERRRSARSRRGRGQQTGGREGRQASGGGGAGSGGG